MDPYTPKTFAVGEILTAQDVNTHLVNNIRRTILRDEAVVQMTNGTLAPGWGAIAIIDEDADGNKNISWSFGVSGTDFSGSGAVNNNIGTLAPELWPGMLADVGFSSGSAGLRGLAHVSAQTGVITVRWQQSSTSGSAAYFRAAYPVLGT